MTGGDNDRAAACYAADDRAMCTQRHAGVNMASDWSVDGVVWKLELGPGKRSLSSRETPCAGQHSIDGRTEHVP